MSDVTPDESKVLCAVLNQIRIARGQVTGEQLKLIQLYVSQNDVTIDLFAIHQKVGKVKRNGLTGQNGTG